MILEPKRGISSAFPAKAASGSERQSDCSKCARAVLPCIDCPDGFVVADHPGSRIESAGEPATQMGHGFVCRCQTPRYLVMTDRGLVCRPFGVTSEYENSTEDNADDDLPF